MESGDFPHEIKTLQQLKAKRSATVSAMERRIGELTGRAGHNVALQNADAIVSHIEVNRKHGVGVLLERWFGDESNVLSIRSADHFGGRQNFGDAALKVSHRQTDAAAIWATVLDALGSHHVSRILCVPYFPDDVRTALAMKEIFDAPMGTLLMDDAGLPDELMGPLLKKSSLRLAMSPQIREDYQRKFDVSIGHMPPLAPAELISDELQLPNAPDARRGAIVGNVWGSRWLALLLKMAKESGVALDWYSNSGFPVEAERLNESSIFPQARHSDAQLVRALRNTWFGVLPSGTLDARDDRQNIARRSLPSRLIYMMATSQIPVIVLGSRETAAAKFVERAGIGLVADYDAKSFRDAVDRILQRDVNLTMRRKALALGPRYADTGAAEWIWKSLALGKPMDARFEDL
jgi:hypothetical protein